VKTIYAIVLLAPLLGACGDSGPTPEPSGQGQEASAQVQLSEAVPEGSPEAGNESIDGPAVDVGDSAAGGGDSAVGSGEPGANVDGDPNHPHPEWAKIEIDTEAIVGQISPEEYVANIREALRHHGTKDDPVPVDADFLGAWEFDEMVADPFPPHVHAVKGKYVSSKGFMLPDVEFRGITKFHLVRSLWACCFGAPPRLNEMLTISAPDGIGLVYTYNTLEIVGKLDVVFETEDGLINDLYRLHAASIIESDYDDPMAPEGANPEEFLPDVLPEMEF